jgi:hypothetical protein
LLQFEVAEIFLNDVGHGHTKRRSEVLGCHLLLLLRILEKPDQAIRQVLSISRLIKLDREFLSLRHLTEVFNVGTYDRDTIGAGQVSDSAAARG